MSSLGQGRGDTTEPEGDEIKVLLSKLLNWVAGTPALITSVASLCRQKTEGNWAAPSPYPDLVAAGAPLGRMCVCHQGPRFCIWGIKETLRFFSRKAILQGKKSVQAIESIHWKDTSHKCRTEKQSTCAQSCPTLCDPTDCPQKSPGKNTGMGCHFLPQGQGLNPHLLYLLHCRWILFHWATGETFRMDIGI